MIQPAPGVVIEQEWPKWLPDEMLFPVGRVRLSGGDRAGYAAMAAAAPEVARDLTSAGADVIAYACAVGSLCAGVAAERALIDDLESASGKPAISLADASMRGLAAVGAKRLAILTPYSAEANAWVGRYAEARGFGVAGFITTPLGIATVGDMLPAEVAAVASGGLAGLPDADGLWIPCTAIRTLDAIATIEAGSDRPVVSGSQALLWDALRIIGVEPLPGLGRLFA